MPALHAARERAESVSPQAAVSVQPADLIPLTQPVSITVPSNPVSGNITFEQFPMTTYLPPLSASARTAAASCGMLSGISMRFALPPTFMLQYGATDAFSSRL